MSNWSSLQAASVQSRISNPSTTTVRSESPWASDSGHETFLPHSAVPQPCVNTGRHTLKWSSFQLYCCQREQGRVKVDAARRKRKDQDQSNQGLPLVARDSWQLLRYKEQSEQEHRIKYVKHFLSQKFNSLEEEARKRGTIDEDEAYGVGKIAQTALQRLETTTKILDIKLQAGGRKRGAEPEQADGDVRRPCVQHHSEVKRCGALAYMLHVMAEMEECLKEY